MKSLLYSCGISIASKYLAELKQDQWNELGDFLFMQCHPEEPEYLSDRRIPPVAFKATFLFTDGNLSATATLIAKGRNEKAKPYPGQQ